MLTFTEDYFDTEVRDGFAVNELMKRNWAAQLKLLDMVLGICEKYDLTYYIYWGTLLGAVRHKGYIPWDDDLDIAMKRDDYIKFLEVVEKELPEECGVYNSYNEDDCAEIFTRVTNGRALDFSDRKLSQYHGCPFAVGIDIFPLYYIPRDTEQAAVQKAILKYINVLGLAIRETYGEEKVVYDEEIKESLAELEELTGFHFTENRPIRTQLAVLYDKVGRMYNEEDSDVLTFLGYYIQDDYVVEKELLGEGVMLPFEMIQLNAPKEFDVILRKTYGEYMKPRRVKGGHDYPYYKGQLALLGDYIDQLDCKWKTEQVSPVGELVTDEKTGVRFPKEWEEKLYLDNNRKRKVLLYHTSAAGLLGNGEYVVDKLRYIFEEIRGQEDMVLWWFPTLLDNPEMQFIKEMSPRLVQEYHCLLEEYKKENWGILDVSGDRQRAVAMSDAYYGDEGELLRLFKSTGRSVTLQEYESIESHEYDRQEEICGGRD